MSVGWVITMMTMALALAGSDNVHVDVHDDTPHCLVAAAVVVAAGVVHGVLVDNEGDDGEDADSNEDNEGIDVDDDGDGDDESNDAGDDDVDGDDDDEGTSRHWTPDHEVFVAEPQTTTRLQRMLRILCTCSVYVEQECTHALRLLRSLGERQSDRSPLACQEACAPSAASSTSGRLWSSRPQRS